MIVWIGGHKKAEMILLSLFGLVCVCSRIFIGWSFLSDILSGNLLGILVALLCIWLLETKIYNWFTKRSKWAQDIIIVILRTAAICTIVVNLKYYIP